MTKKKSKLNLATSEVIAGVAQQGTAEDATSKTKLEIRKQLVLTRELDDKVKRYLLKESFERNERLSFNGIVIELLEELVKDIKLK